MILHAIICYICERYLKSLDPYLRRLPLFPSRVSSSERNCSPPGAGRWATWPRAPPRRCRLAARRAPRPAPPWRSPSRSAPRWRRRTSTETPPGSLRRSSFAHAGGDFMRFPFQKGVQSRSYTGIIWYNGSIRSISIPGRACQAARPQASPSLRWP